jgi:hypothetical protein
MSTPSNPVVSGRISRSFWTGTMRSALTSLWIAFCAAARFPVRSATVSRSVDGTATPRRPASIAARCSSRSTRSSILMLYSVPRTKPVSDLYVGTLYSLGIGTSATNTCLHARAQLATTHERAGESSKDSPAQFGRSVQDQLQAIRLQQIHRRSGSQAGGGYFGPDIEHE